MALWSVSPDMDSFYLKREELMGIFDKLLSHHHDRHRHHEQHHRHQHHHSHNTPSVINHNAGPVCPNCQFSATPDSRFCQQCGTALG
ncbi:zinc-ribbon domain-containing protein [Dickeya lacustris]|uniref:Zinc-ribbon domain-containing protein n=1 Tax=Dickeya lacustris TaxID=2259638 RepID=A0ABY8GB20_9GAMM|nr:zinc-ribbon domain-containing protein [Dickeya lacustris]WFN57127.1 zinc-ribbon domain-containing protein [Dickeya lacustris]